MHKYEIGKSNEKINERDYVATTEVFLYKNEQLLLNLEKLCVVLYIYRVYQLHLYSCEKSSE